MMTRKLLAVTGLAAASCFTLSAQGAVLASTDFDSSTAAGNTKSNLNWTLNGLNDPGDMSATQFAGGSINMFDANAFVQDIFIPGLNVGNTNSSWETDIAITVAAGFNVTLTDVTFNSVSVSGGQAENVNRRNDYRVTIFNPANAQVATAEQADVSAGTGAGQPLVTLDFADVVLGAGTYTLRIRGGDFLGANETGNHTGLDNLSINGDVSVIPEPSSLALLAIGGLAIARRRRG